MKNKSDIEICREIIQSGIHDKFQDIETAVAHAVNAGATTEQIEAFLNYLKAMYCEVDHESDLCNALDQACQDDKVKELYHKLEDADKEYSSLRGKKYAMAGIVIETVCRDLIKDEKFTFNDINNLLAQVDQNIHKQNQQKGEN